MKNGQEIIHDDSINKSGSYILHDERAHMMSLSLVELQFSETLNSHSNHKIEEIGYCGKQYHKKIVQ